MGSKICSKCILDSTVPEIFYDEDGVCMFAFSDDLNYWTVSVNVNMYEDMLKDYSY